MNVLRRLALCAPLLLVAAPLVAQEDPATRVQTLLEDAFGLCTRGQALLASGERAEADPILRQACERYAEALQQVEGLTVSEPKKALVRQIAHYNTACARALLADEDAAFAALRAALEAGYDDLARLVQDPSLATLRANPRFQNLLARTRARLDKEAVAAARSLLSEEPLFPFEFQVKTLDGADLSLADLRGKVVIVDYWGTWCGPCRQEIPHFVELEREFGDLLEIVGMTFEKEQGEAAEAGVRRFARELGINYTLVMADRALLEKVPDLEGFPTTLILDRRGRVRAREVGYREHGYLRQLVLALLAEEAGAQPEQPKQPEQPEQPAPEQPNPFPERPQPEEDPGVGPF